MRTEQEFCPYAGTVLSIHGWKEAMDENPASAIYLLRHALGVNADDQECHSIPVDIVCSHTMAGSHREATDWAFLLIRQFPVSPMIYLVLPTYHAARCESDLAEAALEKERIRLPPLVQSSLALNRESVWQRTRCATPHFCGMSTVTLAPQFDEVDLEP